MQFFQSILFRILKGRSSKNFVEFGKENFKNMFFYKGSKLGALSSFSVTAFVQKLYNFFSVFRALQKEW